MSRTNSLQDPWAVIRRLEDRVRHLETSSPLENAAINRGGIRVLVPGENTDGPAKVGHDPVSGRRGLLVKDGADWITVEEMAAKKDAAERALMEQKLTAVEEYFDARMDATEAWRNQYGPVINGLVSDMSAVEGVASGAASAASAAQSTANSAKTRADDAHTLIGQMKSAFDGDITKIRNVYNAHIDLYHPGGQKITA